MIFKINIIPFSLTGILHFNEKVLCCSYFKAYFDFFSLKVNLHEIKKLLLIIINNFILNFYI